MVRKESGLEKTVRGARRKYILAPFRYTLVSFLPGEVQKKIAQRYNEDTYGYWGNSFLLETAGGIVMTVVGGIAFPPLYMAGLVITVDGLFNMFKGLCEPCGHPAITIPYHTAKYVKSKISPPVTDPLTLYTDKPRTFQKSFKKMDEQQRKQTINEILAACQKNKELDEWLSEKYPDLVTEVGRDRIIYLEHAEES